MKRFHKITLGGTDLTLSLSFKTSLELNDAGLSPSMIVQSVLENAAQEAEGNASVAEFEFNERNAIQILAIANKPHENLGFDEIGELAAADGFITVYGAIFRYLKEIVIGRSKELKPEEPGEGGSAGK